MSIDALMTTPVLVQRAERTEDRYHQTSLDWATPATTFDGFGWFARADLHITEEFDGRDALVSGNMLYLPADVDVTGRDRVVIGGVTYEVLGEPIRAATPAGQHHVECRLKLVEG